MSSTLLEFRRTLDRLRHGPNALERLMASGETDDQRRARLEVDARIEGLTILAALKPSASGFY
jgi:hypothetical protein